MTDYLLNACEYLGVDAGSVLSHKQYEDEIVLIVDKGIEGCPKYRVPLSLLEAPPLPVPGAYDLSYRELQAAAKDAGIPANQSADELRAALEAEEEE